MAENTLFFYSTFADFLVIKLAENIFFTKRISAPRGTRQAVRRKLTSEANQRGARREIIPG
jgi:hypothetical protein